MYLRLVDISRRTEEIVKRHARKWETLAAQDEVVSVRAARDGLNGVYPDPAT